MTMALDEILADLRTMVGNITSGWMSTAQLAIEAGRLAERVSEVDELLTTARSVLAESDALALGQIIDATHLGAPVARVCDDHPDGVIYGTARHIVVDERAGFPGSGNDVRDCLLRVTTSSGFEAFWPVHELINEYQHGTFVLDYAA